LKFNLREGEECSIGREGYTLAPSLPAATRKEKDFRGRIRKHREGMQKEWCGGRLAVSVFREGKERGFT